MPRELIVAATLLATGLFAAPAGAQDAPGRSIGPPGGLVFALTADPRDGSTLYVASDVGLFKSTARGDVWRNINAGLGGLRLEVVTADPLDSSRIYGISPRGIFSSTDGGESWGPAFADPPFDTRLQFVFLRFYIDPTDSATFFLYSGPDERLYRSTDGGATWEGIGDPQGPGLFAGSLLAISPGDPSTIYANAFRNIFVSRDGGDTWEETSFDQGVYLLAVDAADPDVAYAVRYAGLVESLRLFRTLDGGATWSPTSLGSVVSLAADPRVPGTVYAGQRHEIHRSTDHGATWELLTEPLAEGGYSPFEMHELALGADGTLYAGTSCGVYRYEEDAGWSTANGGLFATEVNAVAVHPTNPGILYAAAAACGLMKSVDGGLRWQRLPLPRERGFNARVFDLAIDPVSPARLYAATDDAFYRSEDGGRSWTDLGVDEGDQFGPFFGAIEVAPSDPRIVYLRRQGRLHRSTNRGKRFSRILDDRTITVNRVRVDPFDARTVYVSMSDLAGPDRLFKTTNGGRAWRTVGRGLPAGGVTHLAISPHDSDVLYALPRKKPVRAVYKSVDGGERFTKANEGLESVLLRNLLVDPNRPEAVYAGTSARGVFRSRDGAATWQAMQEVDRRTDVVALAVTRGAAYAGLRDGGVVEFAKACGERLAAVGATLEVGAGSGPDVAVDGGGRVFVTWTGADGTARARAYGPDGGTLRPGFRIGGASDGFPAAAVDGPGEVLVTFRRRTATANAVRVRAYRIDGKPLGVPGRVDSEPQRTKHATAVARSRAGEGVAVWDSVTADGRSLIRGRRLGRGAAVQGAAFTVRGGADRLLAPTVASDGFGRFAVVWLESLARELGVRMQRYRVDGTPREPLAVLSAAGAGVLEAPPVLAIAPTGEAAVAWLERGSDGNAELRVRWLDADGQPAGEQRLGGASAGVGGVDLAIDGFGNTLAVWSSGDLIRARLFSAGGEARSEEWAIGPGRSPAVALDQGGRGVVVWREGGSIRARRFELECS